MALDHGLLDSLTAGWLEGEFCLPVERWETMLAKSTMPVCSPSLTQTSPLSPAVALGKASSTVALLRSSS